jgi:hypothetical protein
MRFPLRDTTRTPTPPPSTIPELKLDNSVIRQISVHFKDAGSGKRGKPAHVHGIELRWAVLDNPPHSVEDLTKSAFDTASPYPPCQNVITTERYVQFSLIILKGEIITD